MHARGTKNSVVLLYPKLELGNKPHRQGTWEPLSLLAIAGPLEAEGYDVHIVDNRIGDDYQKVISEMEDNIICVGITALVGYQIYNGLEMAKFVKHKFPETPIVWGGWHPSTLPDQTAQDPYVDIVVRGQGEETFLEVVEKLKSKKPLNGIMGITYKENGNLVRNPERPLQDLNKFPSLPYHLLKASSYTLSEGILHYYTSQGCPWDCTFCGVDVVFKRRYIALTPERIVSDLKFLVKKYNIHYIDFYDSNVIFSKERTRALCQGIYESGLNIKWEASGRIEQIARFDDSLLKLLKDSGCQLVSIGVESGSQDMLDLIRKRLNVADVIKGVNLLKSHGIAVRANYIISLPEETWEDFTATLDLIKTLGIQAVLHQYIPVPGSNLYNLDLKKGLIKSPQSLEGWAHFYKSITVSKPWLYKNDALKRQAATYYFRIAYLQTGIKKLLNGIHLGFLFRLYQRIAVFRLHKNNFIFPIDWQLYRLTHKALLWLRIKFS